MSTIAYAALTTKREEATPGTSKEQQPPGIQTWLDSLSALVPSEILALHAAILQVTTKTEGVVTTIVAPAELRFSFYGLIVLSIGLYTITRLVKKAWSSWDYVRALIPAAAFVAWTMLQKSTAFDAVFPTLPGTWRTTLALFAATILVGITSALANVADQSEPHQ